MVVLQLAPNGYSKLNYMLMVALRNKIKACLVAKGFFQVPNIDYMDTFSLVVKIDSIRVILALVAQ
jgi:hypothetical protein